MSLTLSPPVFPQEIFCHIIDCVGSESEFGDLELYVLPCLQGEQRDTLRACSLVCSAFVSPSRRYLFRDIAIPSCDLAPLVALVGILEEYPYVTRYIQNLVLSTAYSEGKGFSEDMFDRFTQQLLRLPSVRNLRIDYSQGLDHAIPTAPADWSRQLPLQLKQFCYRLIETCALSGTLNHLDLTGLPDLSYKPLFSCLPLHTLMVNNSGLPEIDGPTENLRCLHILSCEDVPLDSRVFSLSQLSYLPNLEHLVAHDLCLNNVLPDYLDLDCDIRPSFKLKSLSVDLRIGSSLSDFFGFFLNHAKRVGVKPFRCLEYLSVMVLDPEDLSIFDTLLQDMCALRFLAISIHATELVIYWEDSLLALQLAKNIGPLGPLSCLTTLALQFEDHESVRFIFSVGLLMGSIACNNVIQGFILRIRTMESFDPHPPKGDWSRLASTLASRSKFRWLRNVNVSLLFGLVPGAAVYDNTTRLKEVPFLEDAMEKLKKRPRVQFTHKCVAVLPFIETPDEEG